jgi:biotin carboxyl carrier protein
MRYIATIGEREYLIEIIDEHTLLVNGVRYHIDFESVSEQPVYSLLLDGQSFESYVYEGDEALQVLLHGAHYQAIVEDEREKRLRSTSRSGIAEHAEFHLRAPMPGLVVAIPVSEGQLINKGDVLVVLESMKMQNELKSPRAGTVSRMRVKIGDSVELKQTLLSVV